MRALARAVADGAVSPDEMVRRLADGAVSPDEMVRRLRVDAVTDLGYACVDHQRGVRTGVGEVIYGAGKTAEQIAGIVAAMLAAGQDRVLITGYACVDHQRGVRTGVGEVIYGAGKTAEQIAGIVAAMLAAGQDRVLITRLDADKADALRRLGCDFAYEREARAGVVGDIPEPTGNGEILVVTAGTSDAPVAEEAALTARFLGNRVRGQGRRPAAPWMRFRVRARGAGRRGGGYPRADGQWGDTGRDCRDE